MDIGQRIRPRWAPPLSVQFAAGALIAVLLTLPFGCNQTRDHSVVEQTSAPVVRVLISEHKSRVELAASEPPAVRLNNGPSTRLGLSGGSSLPVALTSDGWQIGDVAYGQGTLSIEPASEGSVSIDGKAYRGRYRLVPRAQGTFDVINDVNIDGYLAGVVAREMLSGWHEEAYRAQAIVARTYGLYVARTGVPGTSYDLFSDTRSQVYGGIAAETSKARDAVDATHGVVVAYGPPGQERIFKAYFSSCCGGITQSSADAFGDPLEEPLSEQNIGPVCAASPRFNWPPVQISKTELTRRIRAWGAANNAPERDLGPLSRIDVMTNNPFGRPASFILTDTRGYRYRLCSEDTRIAINTDAGEGPKIFSSFCKPINDPATIRFTEGHGFGHGVGLCQWCAEEQAIAGMGHEQIVLKAYPKSVLVKAY